MSAAPLPSRSGPPLCRAAILAVGSELLTPSRIDTNSLFITEQLNLLGIEVAYKSVIGDDREELAMARSHRARPGRLCRLLRRARTDR